MSKELEEYKKITKATDAFIKKANSVNQINQYLAIERTYTIQLLKGLNNKKL